MIKPFLLIITSLFISFQTIAQCVRCSSTLVWSDEFNDTSLDLTKWSYETGNGCPDLCGWGNNELEYYTDRTDNIRLSGGSLIIEAKRESYGGSDFTSGKILTRNKFDHTYGCFEARIRMPQGRGLWPAFWMLRHDNNWPMTGEIDIMEYRGDITNETHGTLHYGCAWPANQWDGNTYAHTTDLYTDFHIYKVEWTPEHIKWYFDNTLFKTETRNPSTLNPGSCDDPWPWEQDFFIILNMAVGGWFPGTSDPALIELTKPTLEVDYVRVYEYIPLADMTQNAHNSVVKDLPARIEAEEYDEACDPGIAYYDNTAGNTGGAFRSDNVDIEATADAVAGHNVGWFSAGEWLEYTINVPAGGTYDFVFRTAVDGAGGAFRLEVDGVNASGTVSVPNTWGWQNWTNVPVSNIALTAGQHILRVYVEAVGFNFNYFDVSVNTLPVTFESVTAIKEKDDVVIEWKTSKEEDNSHFIIERSIDGISWNQVAQITGNGTTSQYSKYSFNDKNSLGNANYYRIIQVDFDGERTISKVIRVESYYSANITLKPNPVEDKFTLVSDDRAFDNTFKIECYNGTGELTCVYNNVSMNENIQLCKDIPPGLYYLKITGHNIYNLIRVVKK